MVKFRLILDIDFIIYHLSIDLLIGKLILCWQVIANTRYIYYSIVALLSLKALVALLALIALIALVALGALGALGALVKMLFI